MGVKMEEHWIRFTRFWIGYVFGALTLLPQALSERVPDIKQVQQGYIAPSKLEIECEDIDKSDGKGLPETYIKIDGTSYVLRYDSLGNPVISRYKIKQLEIIKE